MNTIHSQTVEDREITLVRIFDAPRDLVWAAWSDEQHIRHWWGPSGFSNTIDEFDFRSGGHWRFVMHGPNGMDFKNHNVFVEIRKPELIVMDHLEEPEFRVTILFEDMGEQTKMTFRQLFGSAEVCENVKPYAIPGARQTFDKLARHLAAMAGEAPSRK
jgi:uncharacterized protein YndB with AHSA1/START domain